MQQLQAEVLHEKDWQPQRLRVPRADRSLFARPPLAETAEHVRRNHRLLESAPADIQGRSLQQIRQWSRDRVLAAAREYTAGISGESIPEVSPEYVVAGGHQPSLFHPGVWVKNFAIGYLADCTGGVALNLVVDNDTLSTIRLRVPAGDRDHPRIETIPFDDARPARPWEECSVQNRELFESFGERVAAQMQQWTVEPLITEVWPDAVAQLSRSTQLADCFTAARHRLERRWGLRNLELPISRLCALEPFLWFTSHLLAHLPRFHGIYNRVLAEYRAVNHIRSRTHPVPELKTEDGWLEAPFWVWREGDRQRGPLFVRQVGNEVHLSSGGETFARLPLSPRMDACCAVEALQELTARDIRLRTRALTTTLFARLCLSDLFVHGIGGAKYDEMTDRIISRFFGLPAPEFLTLSATLQIPLAEPFPVTPADEAGLRNRLRDYRYNSDRHLADPPPGVQELIDEKCRLIDAQHAVRTTGLSHRERRLCFRANHERFRRFQDVNRQLAGFTTEQQQQTKAELEIVRGRLSANAVLLDREFSFCLYPEEKLREFMTRLSDD